MDPILSGIIGALLGTALTGGGLAAMLAGRLGRMEAKIEALEIDVTEIRKQTDKRIFTIATLVETVINLDTEILAELKAARLARGGRE